MSFQTSGKAQLPEWPEWMDLRTASRYSCASEKTLRSWIHSITDPLPASQRGTKLYIRRRDFDLWMQRQAVEQKSVDVNRVVDEILSSVTR